MSDGEVRYPVKPNFLRRANWHDYTSRCIYMITLVKSPHVPELASIIHPSPDIYRSERTEAGLVASRFLESMFRFHEALKVWKYVVMPDHVHFELFVERELPYPVGRFIGELKAFCTTAWRERTGRGEPFFSPGFHDRIVSHQGQAAILRKYIADNPRRLWIKRHNPDLFMRRHRLSIAGQEYEAIGNIFLLDDMDLQAVRISRRFSPEELHERKLCWLHTIENGGVLVSPFISAAEKRVRDYAFANDGRLILIEQNGFSPRYKPTGQYFDLCAAGRLLMIAPVEYSTARIELTRDWCLRHNGLAEQIAARNCRLTGEVGFV